MNLRRRWTMLLPAVAGAVVLVAGLEVAWRQDAAGSIPGGLLVALSAALVLILLAVALLFEVLWRRPLAALGRWCEAALPGYRRGTERDEVERVRTAVASLVERLEGHRDELKQAAERCRLAYQALQASEERCALLVRSASDGLWEWQPGEEAMVLSPRWKSMLGFADDDLPNRRPAWRQLLHPDDMDNTEAALEAHLSGATGRFEHAFRILHKDGRYRWFLSRASALRHANGRPYRLVGLDTDVTAIRRLESLLVQIVEGTTGCYGEVFFRSLVRHFAAALEVACAFVTECLDQPPTRVRTLAFWSEAGFADNIEYDLAGTPCDAVINGAKTCFHPTDLATLFPAEAGYASYLGVPIFASGGGVIGHLAFLDRKNMGEGVRVDMIFRIFTARAAAELEKRELLQKLTSGPRRGA